MGPPRVSRSEKALDDLPRPEEFRSGDTKQALRPGLALHGHDLLAKGTRCLYHKLRGDAPRAPALGEPPQGLSGETANRDQAILAPSRRPVCDGDHARRAQAVGLGLAGPAHEGNGADLRSHHREPHGPPAHLPAGQWEVVDAAASAAGPESPGDGLLDNLQLGI